MNVVTYIIPNRINNMTSSEQIHPPKVADSALACDSHDWQLVYNQGYRVVCSRCGDRYAGHPLDFRGVAYRPCPGAPHAFEMAGGSGIPDRPCTRCALPDRDPIHHLAR